MNPIAQDTHTHTLKIPLGFISSLVFSLFPPSSFHLLFPPSDVELAKKLLWVFCNKGQNLKGLFGQPSISFFFFLLFLGGRSLFSTSM